jgi:hypothetical protein
MREGEEFFLPAKEDHSCAASGRIFCVVVTLLLATGATAAAQEELPSAVYCRELPCTVIVDWTHEGGIGSLTPDRRYGNPAQLEEWLKRRLTERGFALYESTDANALRILLQPAIANAMCDQMAGTSTDRSCRAVTRVQARLEGPDEARKGVDLPSNIRNQCGSDQLMGADKLAVFVADYIIYAVEEKAKRGRRPVGRC